MLSQNSRLPLQDSTSNLVVISYLRDVERVGSAVSKNVAYKNQSMWGWGRGDRLQHVALKRLLQAADGDAFIGYGRVHPDSSVLASGYRSVK